MKNKIINNSNIIFIFKGTIIGLITGFVVSLFRLFIQGILTQITHLFKLTHQSVMYFILLVMILIIIGIINSLLIKSDSNIKGSGIPEIEGQLMGEICGWYFEYWFRPFSR